MNPELHPDAARNFNEKAEGMLAELRAAAEKPPATPPPDIFRPGAHVAATFGPKDYTKFKITGKTDRLGRTTARYFKHEGREIGLEDEKYKPLAKLSEGIQRTKAFHDMVSSRWVEDQIVDWLAAKYANRTEPPLSEYLIKRRDEEVKEHEIWVPISHLSVESDLPFGNVVFKTITKEMLIVWRRICRGLRRAATPNTQHSWIITSTGSAANCRASPQLLSI
jgi:hypothetical protein